MNYQTRMDAVGIAELHGMWYCHMRGTKVTHMVDSEGANRIMGFPAPAAGCSGCQVITNHAKNVGRPFSRNLLTAPVRDELRKVYNRGNRTTPRICRYPPTKENVAVHIRRGDIATLHLAHPNKLNGQGAARWIPNSVYADHMQHLREVHNVQGQTFGRPKELLFHIFSEGSEDDFQDILGNLGDVVLHIGEDALLTFRCLVAAERLVAGASSFSKAAGILSLGLVYTLNDRKLYSTDAVNHEEYYAAGMINAIGHAPSMLRRGSQGKKYRKSLTEKSQTAQIERINADGGGDITEYIRSSYMPAVGIPAGKLGLVISSLKLAGVVRRVMKKGHACLLDANREECLHDFVAAFEEEIEVAYLSSLGMSPEGIQKCSAAFKGDGRTVASNVAAVGIPSEAECQPAFVALLKYLATWATSKHREMFVGTYKPEGVVLY